MALQFLESVSPSRRKDESSVEGGDSSVTETTEHSNHAIDTPLSGHSNNNATCTHKHESGAAYNLFAMSVSKNNTVSVDCLMCSLPREKLCDLS